MVMGNNRYGIENSVQRLRELAEKARLEEFDYDQWFYLHVDAISFLIEAELYKCPDRTNALFEISDTLDENALPIDFHKRLVSLHRDLAISGNRRTRNHVRNQIIKTNFLNLRRGFWTRNIDETKRTFRQLGYEDSIKSIANDFGLSDKSIETIISTESEYFNISDGLDSSDFDRFFTENEKRKP